MSILFISDLHLCDGRNSRAFEVRRLELLAVWIRQRQFDLVINLGDTVSREGCLREGLSPYRKELFEEYLAWRKTLSTPVLECGLHREFPFFEELYDQPINCVYRGLPGVTAFALTPYSSDNVFTEQQWHWFENELGKSEATTVVIGAHVPYPNSCSRPPAECCYLKVPDHIHHRLETFPSPIFWAGGHYHWPIEPPVKLGSLTAFMGGRFGFESEPQKKTYLRVLDTQKMTLETVTDVNLL